MSTRAELRLVVVAAAAMVATAVAGGQVPGKDGTATQTVDVTAKVVSSADRALLMRVLRAEDARARDPGDLATLVEGAHSGNAIVRRLAVRAEGRLERADLIPQIATALADPSPDVRFAAADALAQAATHDGGALARAALNARFDQEHNSNVLAMLAESLGRVPSGSAEELRATADRLGRLLPPATGGFSFDLPAIRGAVRGLFFLTKIRAARGVITDSVKDQLRRIISFSRTGAQGTLEGTMSGDSPYAAAALIAAGVPGRPTVDAILESADPYVREKAVAAVVLLPDSAAVHTLLNQTLTDSAAIVRFRGLAAFIRLRLYTRDCTPIVTAIGDRDVSVGLAAVDTVTNCRADPRVVPLLDSIAATLATSGPAADHWQMAAHALVSLAAVAPDRARARLPRFLSSSNLFVRTYAATTTRRLSDLPDLYRLADDREPNVRSAAVEGLSALVGHAADTVYLRALGSNDSQLLRSAAMALRGSHDSSVFRALATTLDRVTALRRENSRDGRLALVDRMKEFGGAPVAERLHRYLADFDSAVAAHAADDIAAWTGQRPAIAPTPLPPTPFPDFNQLVAIEKAHVLIEMEDGGTIELALFPFDAPTNAARLVRLARAGYFDGLTLHRVVPFFVVQGGSPDANEYMGDGPFTRDEVGLENQRGTVGVSTRGHDTGDGQLYINTVDNTQLDHEYTVYAWIVSGMAVVDQLQEGARIRRVTVR